ncbi:adenosyl-hopene transferase HpnH [Thermopetrobacter sp. TC1]|uniref:adenosyl-hopene transferase HpnH n=1 Tax=Thermopetrobacter sp. TC1 TaxID=1495045 RepID=UPI00068D2008|nr:adenosyl-hopene transferase HpnH [Thermopetrobacter sp. TC1]
MAVPLIQQIRVGAYILKQKLAGRARYPLVLMLEPLFRCNLACPGCGKIAHPDDILNKRLSVEDCVAAAEECGAPIVSIPGGEPLIHKEMPQIVKALIARKKFVYLCTNGLLLEKKLDDYDPSPYLTFSVHLDGLGRDHDRAVGQDGVFERTVSAIRAALNRGHRVTVNCTLFNDAEPRKAADFFDFVMALGVESITVSAGYAYEKASAQEHFLSRTQTKALFRELFRIQKQEKKRWRFNQSLFYLDFLAGNRRYQCTPWGNPTYNVFGWQQPCYLIDEGHAPTFRALMEETDWAAYGVGRYEKCSDCMVHSGFEPTAVNDMVSHPLQALKLLIKGIRTEGPMAEDFDLSGARAVREESGSGEKTAENPPQTAERKRA